ncbi:hypothetical protein ABT381_35750, partial [Streptomyces sp. NPDC000151]
MAGRTDSGQPETAFPAEPGYTAGAEGYGPAPRMVPLMDPDTGLPFVDEFGVAAGPAPTGSGQVPTDSAGPVPTGPPPAPYWAAASEPIPDPAPVRLASAGGRNGGAVAIAVRDYGVGL